MFLGGWVMSGVVDVGVLVEVFGGLGGVVSGGLGWYVGV